MGKSIKKNIARALAGNAALNKRVIQMKKSWDEVSSAIEKAGSKSKKK